MIVITGPSGNVGTELTRLMLAREMPEPYRICAYDMEEIKALCGDEGPYVPFDYDDRSTWDAALDGVTTLYLLFCLPTTRGAKKRMMPFMDAAVRAGVQHIVFISVGSARESKGVPHYPAEKYLRELGVPYTIIRPCFYMQNLCRNITTHDYDIAVEDEIFIPAGDGCTTWVDSRDVAEAVLKILLEPAAHKNKEYRFTGSEQKTFAEVAEVFSREVGRPIRYAKPSLPYFVYRMMRRGIPWDVVAFMCFFYSVIRFGKPEPLTDDMQRLLGRDPRTLDQFIRDHMPYWQAQTHTEKPAVPDWAGGPRKTPADYRALRDMTQLLQQRQAGADSSV